MEMTFDNEFLDHPRVEGYAFQPYWVTLTSYACYE